MKQRIYNIFMFLAICSLGIFQYLGYNNKKEYIYYERPIVEEKEIEPLFFNKSPKDGLKEALEYYNVAHSDIVYAQAVLETGNFKSDLCVNSNNLFGLYNSSKGAYYKYKHWSESIQDYVRLIQSRYDSDIDYYQFLDRIEYAEDPKYIDKLKQIVKYDKRRSR